MKKNCRFVRVQRRKSKLLIVTSYNLFAFAKVSLRNVRILNIIVCEFVFRLLHLENNPIQIVFKQYNVKCD